MDAFAEERVPATFFVTGKKLAARGDVTRRTWIEGHEVGSHTFNHVRLTELPRAEQQAEIDRVDAALQEVGVPAPTLLRPPFLAQDLNTRRLGKARIMNDTNPQDWRGVSAQQIRSFIRNNVRSGSIVILHDTMPNTVAASPGILDDMRQAGYTVVTVRELLPDLRPGDLVYNRRTVYPLSVDLSASQAVPLDDGRELEPPEDTTGPLTP